MRFTFYKFGVKNEEVALGRACCTEGRYEEYRVLLKSHERKQTFRKHRLDRRIILKWIVKNMSLCLLDLSGSRRRSFAASCKHVNKILSYTKCEVLNNWSTVVFIRRILLKVFVKFEFVRKIWGPSQRNWVLYFSWWNLKKKWFWTRSVRFALISGSRTAI